MRKELIAGAADTVADIKRITKDVSPETYSLMENADRKKAVLGVEQDTFTYWPLSIEDDGQILRVKIPDNVEILRTDILMLVAIKYNGHSMISVSGGRNVKKGIAALNVDDTVEEVKKIKNVSELGDMSMFISAESEEALEILLDSVEYFTQYLSYKSAFKRFIINPKGNETDETVLKIGRLGVKSNITIQSDGFIGRYRKALIRRVLHDTSGPLDYGMEVFTSIGGKTIDCRQHLKNAAKELRKLGVECIEKRDTYGTSSVRFHSIAEPLNDRGLKFCMEEHYSWHTECSRYYSRDIEELVKKAMDDSIHILIKCGDIEIRENDRNLTVNCMLGDSNKLYLKVDYTGGINMIDCTDTVIDTIEHVMNSRHMVAEIGWIVNKIHRLMNGV